MIADAVLAKIYAHARAAFPAECCGYVREGGEVVACTNTQATGDNPFAPDRGADSGFSISGAELLAFARSFDSPHPARVVYHSHPNGRAYFSDVDRAAAASDAGPVYPVQHLVVGVTASGVSEAALFAWSGGQFVETTRWGLDALVFAVDAAMQSVPAWREAYEAVVARVGAHLDAGGFIDDAGLTMLCDRVDAAASAVPPDELEAHRKWSRPRKYVPGFILPGRESPTLAARVRLHEDALDLRYRGARARTQADCDCQILRDLAITDRHPSSSALRSIAGDGMYWEDYVCDACGARWTKHMDCDDVGVHSSWQPTR